MGISMYWIFGHLTSDSGYQQIGHLLKRLKNKVKIVWVNGGFYNSLYELTAEDIKNFFEFHLAIWMKPQCYNEYSNLTST
jgi:hypothetical protein